eukprot:451802_1
MMSSALPNTFTISRAGTSMINGIYSLDTTNNTIKYTKKATHPLSNKSMIIEIIKTKIPQLDSNQTYFLIHTRNLSSNKKSIHYYASTSPFTSINQEWQIIAGLYPLPKLLMSPVQFNKMSSTLSIQKSFKKDNDEKKQSFIEMELSNIKPTIRTFLKNTYLFENNAIIVHEGRDSKHGQFIICNNTIFHPQGGGQPTDKGIIKNENIIFNVEFVANHHSNHQLVCHFGSYSTNNSFKIGDKVKQNINQKDRMNFARIHSGGHLIDIGMDIISKELNIKFEPIKGFHFPSGPYVEYEGNIPLEKRGEMKDLLQNTMDELIKNNESLKTVIKTMRCDEYLDNVVKIMDNKQREQHMNKMKINTESMVRVVSFPDFPNGECMCGGTHIDALNRIKKITITKFKKKNRNFRVSYKVQ